MLCVSPTQQLSFYSHSLAIRFLTEKSITPSPTASVSHLNHTPLQRKHRSSNISLTVTAMRLADRVRKNGGVVCTNCNQGNWCQRQKYYLCSRVTIMWRVLTNHIPQRLTLFQTNCNLACYVPETSFHQFRTKEGGRNLYRNVGNVYHFNKLQYPEDSIVNMDGHTRTKI
jgi:hypothetical protein